MFGELPSVYRGRMSIVVAYTPDPAGQSALDWGIAEAKLRGTDLIVVNATRGVARIDPRLAGSGEVRDVDEVLRAAGIEHSIVQPTGPDVVDLVLAEVERAGADLLVLGLRRRTPVGKLIMGSTSQRLLLDSPVPVFAVHPGPA